MVWEKIFRDIKVLKFHEVSRMLVVKSNGRRSVSEIRNIESHGFLAILLAKTEIGDDKNDDF